MDVDGILEAARNKGINPLVSFFFFSFSLRKWGFFVVFGSLHCRAITKAYGNKELGNLSLNCPPGSHISNGIITMSTHLYLERFKTYAVMNSPSLTQIEPRNAICINKPNYSLPSLTFPSGPSQLSSSFIEFRIPSCIQLGHPLSPVASQYLPGRTSCALSAA